MHIILVEISEGWGSYSCGQKNENSREEGCFCEIPSVVGVWIFSGTTHLCFGRY